MQGLLGKKVGMTQIYDNTGRAIPVTVIEAGPCVVVQRKTEATDGYSAVQLGLVEGRAPRKVTSARRGHFKKHGVEPVRKIAEVAIDGDVDPKPGDEVKVGMFLRDRFVNVVGTSKGKGFQGVMKRHGFGGGRASHGSMFHRAPGSIGQSASPSRVFPGIKLPGQMGSKRITTKNLEVVKIIAEENLLFVVGSVPGARNSVVLIERATKGRGDREPSEQELAAEQAAVAATSTAASEEVAQDAVEEVEAVAEAATEETPVEDAPTADAEEGNNEPS
jgi:large subunit ribosomal protein L3